MATASTKHTGKIFDADNHMYENPDALTKYLPAKHAGVIEFVQIRGRTRIALQGHITDYIPNPTFDRVAAPGKHVKYFSGDNPEGLTLRQMTGEPITSPPSFRAPAPRLELLDQQGVERTLMFPTLCNLVEQRLVGPDVTADVIHAFNQWMHEHWTFDFKDRIFAMPVLPMGLVDRAIAELEWVLERGAKGVLIRPAPAIGHEGSRSIAMPEYDPFWARVQEAGIPIMVHATDSVITPYVNLWEPERTQSAFQYSTFRKMAMGHRDIYDFLSSLICHGALTRFPRVKIVSVENGSEWVSHLFDAIAFVHRQIPQDFTEHPHDVFRRNISVCPFWEDDVAGLVDLIGDESVMFGSDFPHPEGLAEPSEYFQYLAGFNDRVVAKIMWENLNRVTGLPQAA
jgi:predicted TIM-barrel fold metal-dependent hydrolase